MSGLRCPVKNKFFEVMNDKKTSSIEAWKNSRSGAWAGRGFHFQHLFSVLVLVRQWAGLAPAGNLVPEGLDDCVVELKSDNRTKSVSIEVVSPPSPDSTPVNSQPPSNPVLLGPIVKTRTSFSDSGYGDEGEDEEEKTPIITLSSRRRGAKKVKTWFETSATTAIPETDKPVSQETTTEQPMVVGFVNPFTRTPVTTATIVKDTPSVLGGLVSRSVVAAEPELTLPRHDPSVQEQYFKFDTPSRDDIVREAQGVLTK